MGRILRVVTDRMHRNVDMGSYSGFVFLLIYKALIEDLRCTRNYTRFRMHKDELDMVPNF